MKTYQQFLVEIKSTSHEWFSNGGDNAAFYLEDGSKVSVKFEGSPAAPDLVFLVNDVYAHYAHNSKTNLNAPALVNVAKMFKTIYEIVLDYIKKRSPDYIKFDSFLGEPSRVRLYKTFIDKVNQGAIPGYKGKQSEKEHDDSFSPVFYIYKEGYDID